MATDMILHIAKLGRDFATDATDEVLLVSSCPLICSLDLVEVTSDSLLILTHHVDVLIFGADDNTSVPSLRLRLPVD